MTSEDVVAKLRRHQEADPTFGLFFLALHTFADRTIDEFFYDYPDMPRPVISVDKDRRTRLGKYRVRDGYALFHSINLNVFALKSGTDAAETLAHELVHMWETHAGKPAKNNVHTDEFHQRMALMGIHTEGPRGHHVGYTDGRWQAWLEENDDLNLGQYVLPGADAKKPRRMLKLKCACGNTIHHRRALSIMCLDCEEPYEVQS